MSTLTAVPTEAPVRTSTNRQLRYRARTPEQVKQLKSFVAGFADLNTMLLLELTPTYLQARMVNGVENVIRGHRVDLSGVLELQGELAAPDLVLVGIVNVAQLTKKLSLFTESVEVVLDVVQLDGRLTAKDELTLRGERLQVSCKVGDPRLFGGPEVIPNEEKFYERICAESQMMAVAEIDETEYKLLLSITAQTHDDQKVQFANAYVKFTAHPDGRVLMTSPTVEDLGYAKSYLVDSPFSYELCNTVVGEKAVEEPTSFMFTTETLKLLKARRGVRLLLSPLGYLVFEEVAAEPFLDDLRTVVMSVADQN